jgi:hypothetical protein
MKRLIIIYGLIAGAVVSAFMSSSMIYMSKNDSMDHGTLAMVIGYLGMLISFTFIFVAIKSYRDKQNNGIISFGKAFGMGLLIALIASTMYVIAWAIVYKNFLPNFMENYSATMIQDAKTSLSGDALQKEIAGINKAKDMYATPWGFTLFTYAEILPVGILVSLIAALVLKRKRGKAVLA